MKKKKPYLLFFACWQIVPLACMLQRLSPKNIKNPLLLVLVQKKKQKGSLTY